MKYNYTPLIQLRRKVFVEVAKMAYDDPSHLEENIEQAVYNIVPGEVAQYRESVFKERAIVGERLRMAMGLKMRKVDEHQRLSQGIDDALKPERVVHNELIQVVPFACEACPEKTYHVTENCRKCLAHPCIQDCPKNAISMGKYGSIIDDEKCIRCGKCKEACPYNAIIDYDRPCAKACGVNAIKSDYLGRAEIEQDKCVKCGMCLSACPFGAISDKSEIFQLIQAIKSDVDVHAIIAPAFIGQFGPFAKPDTIFRAIKALGFKSVVEVALGADIESVVEAREFIEKVPNELSFLGTSCCPAWYDAATLNFPEMKENISSSATPMVATSRFIKKENPDAKVVFIGPCLAKKNEASRPELENIIDFVITFEELMGMFVAYGIQLDDYVDDTEKRESDASLSGRGFANAGGVAEAIINTISEMDPSVEVKYYNADGLHECMKMLKLAKAHKYDGYLLEGMGCPGGCVGGPGTLISRRKAAQQLNEFKTESPYFTAFENPKVPADKNTTKEV